MQRKFLQPPKGLVNYTRPTTYVFGKPTKYRQTNPVAIIAVIIVVAVIIGILVSSSKAKATDVEFPEEIPIVDGKGTTLKPLVDISPYYDELESLLEEHYEGTDVVALKLYSYVTNDCSIQYLVWFSSDSDMYTLDQFSSATITEFLRGNVKKVECNSFVAGDSGGAFIIEEF